jgi:hypothetical protein
MIIESLIWQAAYQKRLHRTAQERGSKVMDSAYISALAALAGSSIGGLATFATTGLIKATNTKFSVTQMNVRAEKSSSEISCMRPRRPIATRW